MTRKKNRNDFFGKNFWQSANYNARVFQLYLDELVSLAINRFRWVGLPDTCDAQFFELALHRDGIATICHPENMPDVWHSLIAIQQGGFNVYGRPLKWDAMGYDSGAGTETTRYAVTPKNGEVCYYSFSRQGPWNALEIFARKMAHYSRTEDINLTHQHTPWLLLAPQEKRLELINLYKQIEGGEPAVLADDKFSSIAGNLTAINTGVTFIGEDLARAKLNVFNDALMYLGIPHLAFEKGERMIEDEARANTASTNVMLLDCLQARRQFCEKVNSRFGLNIQCYFNDDLESYNYNYLNNMEAIAQDGLLEGGRGE